MHRMSLSQAEQNLNRKKGTQKKNDDKKQQQLQTKITFNSCVLCVMCMCILQCLLFYCLLINGNANGCFFLSVVTVYLPEKWSALKLVGHCSRSILSWIVRVLCPWYTLFSAILLSFASPSFIQKSMLKNLCNWRNNINGIARTHTSRKKKLTTKTQMSTLKRHNWTRCASRLRAASNLPMYINSPVELIANFVHQLEHSIQSIVRWAIATFLVVFCSILCFARHIQNETTKKAKNMNILYAKCSLVASKFILSRCCVLFFFGWLFNLVLLSAVCARVHVFVIVWWLVWTLPHG